MSLKEQIQQDLNSAIKDHYPPTTLPVSPSRPKKEREIEVSSLRMLNAAIINKEKEKRYKLSKEEPELKVEELAEKSELTDEEVIQVISSEIKKRKEAILEFEKGERQDLIEKEKKEIEVLKKYLPEQLSEEELKKLVKEAIERVAAVGPKDIGKIMTELMPRVKGKADGATVSKIVKELLQT